MTVAVIEHTFVQNGCKLSSTYCKTPATTKKATQTAKSMIRFLSVVVFFVGIVSPVLYYFIIDVFTFQYCIF